LWRRYREATITKTLAIISQKGGTAKTCTAAALIAGLRREGKRVLAVDTDPQANLTAMIGGDPSGATRGLYDVLTGHSVLRRAVQTTAQGPIVGADSRLAEKGILHGRNAEYRLKTALDSVANEYDVVIVDCPPNLSTLTYSALTAADGAIIPAKADRFSMDALRQIAATINAVKSSSNSRLQVYGVLITMYERRLTVARLMRDKLEEQARALGLPMYATSIRKSVSVEESQITGEDIFKAGHSNAAADYNEIIKELLKQMD